MAFSYKDIFDALNISIDKVADDFGYTKEEFLTIVEGSRPMTKVEAKAFQNATGVSEGFLKSGVATNKNEMIVKKYFEQKEQKNMKKNIQSEILEQFKIAGYPIRITELTDYYDYEQDRIRKEILLSDNPRLLIALSKVFPDKKFTNTLDDHSPYSVHSSDKKLLKYSTWEEVKEKIDWTEVSNNSDYVYFSKRFTGMLNAFIKGFYEWDNEKVLYLINNGAYCVSFLGKTKEEYEEVTPIMEKDIAKTLLIKDYCERQLLKK